MISLDRFLKNEAVLTFFLWVLFLIQYVLDRSNPSISVSDFLFTLNYVIGSTVINQLMIPKLFYKDRYWLFFALFFLLIVCSMLIEELVLEPMYFSKTRGGYFNPIYGMIEIGAILSIFAGFKFGFDGWKRQLVINQLQKEKSASQLDHLKSQISPHFLFNNLNNLYSKALEQDPETPQLIHRLANLMRYMLYESNEDFVPLSKEIAHLEDYVALQKVQLEERGKIDFMVTLKNEENPKIAPLLLIGFVENCFKHSFSQLTSEYEIRIHLKVEGRTLHFYCANPYSMDKEKVDEGLPKGIGLKNVKGRLALLYKDRHTLEIQKTMSEFAVTLTLELEG